MEELKPCPFCGGSDLFIHDTPSSDKSIMWYIISHGASLECSIAMINSSKEDLIKNWNRRVNVDTDLLDSIASKNRENEEFIRNGMSGS